MERLYPDEYHLQTLNNMDIIDGLARQGDKGGKPRDVRFFLHVRSTTELDLCREAAEESGFEYADTTDAREGSGMDGATDDRPVTLVLKKQLALNLDALNADAALLIDIANRYDGHFDGCEADLVK